MNNVSENVSIKIGDLVIPNIDKKYLNSYIVGYKDINEKNSVIVSPNQAGLVSGVNLEKNKVCVEFNFGTRQQPILVNTWLALSQVKNITQ